MYTKLLIVAMNVIQPGVITSEKLYFLIFPTMRERAIKFLYDLEFLILVNLVKINREKRENQLRDLGRSVE